MVSYTLLELQGSADPHLARRLHSGPGLGVVRVSPHSGDTATTSQSEKATAEFQLSSGRVYLRLPYSDLCSLAEHIRQEPEERSYALLLHVSKAAALLPDNTGFSLDPKFVFLTTEAPLVSPVLFLPAAGVAELRRMQRNADREHASNECQFSNCEHEGLDFDPPDRTGAAITAFGLAALWYRQLSSQPLCMNPEASPGTPRLYERFGESFPAMPANLKEAFDACVAGHRPASTRSESSPARTRQLINELVQSLSAASPALSRTLASNKRSTKELHQLRTQAARSRKARVRRFHRQDFLRQRGARLATVTALVLLLGGIAGTSIDRALQPPPTHGLAPMEVVQLHYAALNELDPELLRATLARGVASRRVDELTTMYVTSRARMSVEMETGHYRADDWIRQGRPELSPSVYPYGVSTPDIRELAREDDSARYEARFTRVYLEFADEGREQGAAIREDRIQEELQLELRNEVWRIVAIDAQIEEPTSESH